MSTPSRRTPARPSALGRMPVHPGTSFQSSTLSGMNGMVSPSGLEPPLTRNDPLISNMDMATPGDVETVTFSSRLSLTVHARGRSPPHGTPTGDRRAGRRILSRRTTAPDSGRVRTSREGRQSDGHAAGRTPSRLPPPPCAVPPVTPTPLPGTPGERIRPRRRTVTGP